MAITKRAPTGVVCPGSGLEPKVFKLKPEMPEWKTCPVCTRVFNVTQRGLVPRHLTRSRAARMNSPKD